VIHTFGYGYDVESKNLYEIAKCGGGVFSFIPDSTMVGTAIVNVMASAGAILYPKTFLSIDSSTDILSVEGHETGKPSQYLVFEFGSVQFGQTRDLLLRLSPTKNGSAPVVTVKAFFKTKYNPESTPEAFVQVNNFSDVNSEEGHKRTVNTIVELSCAKLIAALREVPKYGKRENDKLIPSFKMVEEFIQNLNLNSVAAGDERLVSLLSDIHNEENENVGQIGKALQNVNWFDKWGYTYLLSLLSALEQQQCHNFKDKSVQRFGGALFSQLQEKSQTAFCTLPPPTHVGGSTFNATTTSTPSNMQSYMNYSGGCFSGNGLVQISTKTLNKSSVSKDGVHLKRVDQIKKGDVLLVDEKEATVRCVVNTPYPTGADVVDLKGLKLTPFHPVLYQDEKGRETWQFPVLIPGCKLEPFEGNMLFDFVLDSEHLAVINGVKCITLGHGREEEVAKHPYFGSKLVIEDLEKLSGWEDGNVQIGKLLRDDNSNLINGIVSQIPVLA